MSSSPTASFQVLEDWLLEQEERWALIVLRKRAYLYEQLRLVGCLTLHCAGSALLGTHVRLRLDEPAHHDTRCDHGELLRALGGDHETVVQVNAGHALALNSPAWWARTPKPVTGPMQPPGPTSPYAGIGMTGALLTYGSSGGTSGSGYPLPGIQLPMGLSPPARVEPTCVDCLLPQSRCECEEMRQAQEDAQMAPPPRYPAEAAARANPLCPRCEGSGYVEGPEPSYCHCGYEPMTMGTVRHRLEGED